MTIHHSRRRHARSRPRPRRGFNLIELLMALAISAALLSATMLALDASFVAYQRTTEVASTHTVGRLAMHRMLALIRTGEDFRPLPDDPLDAVVQSDFLEFETREGEIIAIEWDEDDEALYVRIGGEGGLAYLLLEGVTAQRDDDDELILPFTLEYERGFTLHRVTIDLAIVPDDNMSVTLDGENAEMIRLVATAMPREAAYGD